MTYESGLRADAALRPFLRPPYVEPTQDVEMLEFVMLDCEVLPSCRLACGAETTAPTDPSWLMDAALAYAAELEACPGEPRQLGVLVWFGVETPRPDPLP